MDSRLIQAFSHWFTIGANLLSIIGIVFFIKLPKDKRVNIQYWLPFFILIFTVFYENIGSYTNYNYDFKKAVNAYLGNTEYPQFNLWLYNVARRQLGVILYLLLIQNWLQPAHKEYINWMIYGFIVLVFALQVSGIQPLYLNQPIIFAIGANLILIGSGLYFIGMITHDQYLESNPLRLVSFWQMTIIFFSFSLNYISSVALLYLYQVNPVLGKALQDISNALFLCTLGAFIVTIASPLFPRIFEKEPSYGIN
ncbi:MAG: histidine kinase [Algoriphagus sp.]|uniref:histidine kinase n=1 Tax=Algoriphagus sp. TaxID=1872435 RepID=UPI00260698A4|nr:histidine kinase [Algoriphagus sp.]MDG1275827.1 histidine kinase [Algoriphagus sp.]